MGIYTWRKEVVWGENLANLTTRGSCTAGSGMEMPLKYELLEKMSMCLGVRSPDRQTERAVILEIMV